MIYDVSVTLPGLHWTPAHSSQGFARQASVVNFRTLMYDGMAKLTVYQSEYKPTSTYARVISVPFTVTSGNVMVNGPDEDQPRIFAMLVGYYKVTAAQRVSEEGIYDEVIDIYFDRRDTAVSGSEIEIADEAITTDGPLLEYAETMEIP